VPSFTFSDMLAKSGYFLVHSARYEERRQKGEADEKARRIQQIPKQLIPVVLYNRYYM
jgi:hypothetical protein